MLNLIEQPQRRETLIGSDGMNKNHLTAEGATDDVGFVLDASRMDPETRAFSPGSVLSFLNTQSAWEQAREAGKPLRFSFGRADREYKDRWCNPVPVLSV